MPGPVMRRKLKVPATGQDMELSNWELLSSALPPAPLVAGVPPAMLSGLRRKGKDLLDRWLTKAPQEGFSPTFQEAMQFLQERYPRTFGHVTNLRSQASQPFYAGQWFPGPRGSKTGEIALNPRTAILATPAHELQHGAQGIVKGSNRFVDEYLDLQRKLGYAANPHEWLADIQGSTFVDDFGKWLRAGKPRYPSGRPRITRRPPVPPEARGRPWE